MYELKLKDIRKSRGMNQKELAKALNSTQRVISSYETGDSQIPLSVAFEIAKVLGCSVDELAGGRPSTAARAEHVTIDVRDLNRAGIDKVQAYADDLDASGRYDKKSYPVSAGMSA